MKGVEKGFFNFSVVFPYCSGIGNNSCSCSKNVCCTAAIFAFVFNFLKTWPLQAGLLEGRPKNWDNKMMQYKVVPAPRRGLKGKGVRGSEGKFANALETVMNELAAEGWQYLRTDTLPAEEREGLMGRTTVFQNMLVFQRPMAVEQPTQQDVTAAMVAPAVAAPAVMAAATTQEASQEPQADDIEDLQEEPPLEQVEEEISASQQDSEDEAAFRREPRLVSDDSN